MKIKLPLIIMLLCASTYTLFGQSLGDVNSDSSITIVDALLVAQYYVGLNPPDFNAGYADTDGNGQINIIDALLIAQYYVGLITEFPGQTATQGPTAPPTQPPETGNLLVNGDFESGDLASWTKWNESRIGDWKANSGAYCAAVGPSAPASIEQRITVEPNTIYELSGYLLVDNIGEQVNLGVKDYGGTEISASVTVNSFQYRSLRFTTAESTTRAVIYIYKSTGTGWSYGDDIRVLKVGGYTGGPLPPALPGNWQMVFRDEFEGNSLDKTKWSTGYPWGSNYHNHRAYMDPANIVVGNGMLRLMAENRRHPDAPDGIQRDDFGWLSLDYTAGVVTTSGKYHFDHGYMEARLRMPPTRGFWPAFWTLGDGWPPEIDIVEFLSSEPARFYTNYHWGQPEYGSHFTEHRKMNLTTDFHIFAVEWDSSHMTWYLDGSEIARYTNSKCSQAVNQYILLNLGVGGWEEDPDGTTEWPGYYDIDWVRVWQK